MGTSMHRTTPTTMVPRTVSPLIVPKVLSEAPAGPRPFGPYFRRATTQAVMAQPATVQASRIRYERGRG
jgi:hypothetical protein